MPTPRRFVAHTILSGRLFVIGGDSTLDGDTNHVENYDPITNKWLTTAPMCHPRRFATACALNGFIYVFGGKNREATKSIERYDPAQNSWDEEVS